MPKKDRVMKQWDDAAESWADFVGKAKIDQSIEHQPAHLQQRQWLRFQ